jgi:hemerythrin superfamily protein
VGVAAWAASCRVPAAEPIRIASQLAWLRSNEEVPVSKDAISLIEQDHRELEALFERLKTEVDQRPALLRKVAVMLVAHSKAEESEVYPAAEREAGEAEEIGHAHEEHEEAENLLHELEQSDPGSDHFDTKLQELVSAVQHHVQEEESNVLPRLHEAVGPDRLEELGAAFEKREKAEMTQAEKGARPDQTKEQLYEQAKQAGVEGRSDMTKDELADALRKDTGG